MKKFTKLAVMFLVAVFLTVATSAAQFEKKQNYPEGKFSDVSDSKWYAAEVKNSFELGLMNGQSDSLFAPEGNVTVAEGITMACRVHAIYNGKTIADKSGGKWYDMYTAYAVENGLINEGQFSNYDRNIMRYEMAVLFASAMPESHFAAKNDIKGIPDVAKTEEYYNELMMLYKAGVVTGSNEYGDFYATNAITRSETAAIINRVALPENRKNVTLKEYGNRNPAVFLIDDSNFARSINNDVTFGSGWLVEDTISQGFNKNGGYAANLSDRSDKGAVYAHRDVSVQTTGVVKAEINYTVTGSGGRIIFFNSDKESFFELVHKDGKLIALGDKEYDTGFAISFGAIKLYAELDLDAEKVFISISGKDIGTFNTKPIKDFARFSFGTSDKEAGGVGPGAVHMYVNYDVYDVFRYSAEGEKPYGWETVGNVTIAPVKSAYDKGGVKIEGKGSLTKKFTPVGEKFVYETYLLVPEGQTAYVSLMNGAKQAIKVNTTADGKFVCANTEIRKFDSRVWQQVRIEADTAANKALIKINGKAYKTVDFAEDSVDSIVIGFEGNGNLLVDDVKLFNVYDYTDYCPTPVPVNDDEWYVGVSVCSLWREGTHGGWQYIDGYDDIEPVIGYYDEGIPEVADWEIKFLAEHGYDFMQYCWFVGDQYYEPIKNTRMGAALHDGYMNAKYSDMVDFSIMWENNTGSLTDSKYFYDYIWPYWCEHFFSDSRYMRVDNKAVVTIYVFDRFIAQMGGEEKAKEVIAFMKEDIKKLGYDGMIVLFTDSTRTTSVTAARMENVGADGRIAYHLGEMGYVADFQKSATENIFATGKPAYLPSVGIGFNDVGWTHSRTPLATPETFKEVLDWTKNTYLPKVAASEDEAWYGKFVMTNTWNEYGEGHYIIPSSLNEFGYVDQNRAVFSTVAGKNDTKHFDVKPTDNQKARLNVMHAGAHTTLRKQDHIKEEKTYDLSEVVYKFDFSDENVCKLWKPSGCTDFGYDAEEKAISGKAVKSGHMYNTPVEGVEVDADKAKYIRITMKVDGAPEETGRFYFRDQGSESFSESRAISFRYTNNTDGYIEVIIDLSGNAYWKGPVRYMRVDPCSSEASFSIKSIEFLSGARKDDLVFDIDGYELGITKDQFTMENGEIYVAANPVKGFYSLHNMYYEWNRKTGIMFLKTSTNTEFVFTVGSNKVTVNGAEKTLPAEIKLYDGLVCLPVKFIYDNAGIEYSITENKVSVNIREDVSVDASKKVDYQWEFNTSDDTEGWKYTNATGGVNNGVLAMTATAVASSGTGYDSMIQKREITIPADIYTTVDVRLKALFDGEPKDTTLSIYFATLTESGLNEAKCVRTNLKNLTPDAEGFYNFTVDMKVNAKWTGTVTMIRVDPTNSGGYFEFDYIRFQVDPAMKEAAEELAQEQTKDKEKLMAADEGAPFYIKNSDAESITIIAVDPDNANNKAYLVKPSVKDKMSWTYFYVPTRFKPGVTYKIEYDIKAISDHTGKPVTNAKFVPNIRYTDVNASGALVPRMDHPINTGVVKSSTGGGWIHCSIEHTVSEKSSERSNDYFTVYSEPFGTNEAPGNVSFMIDNIVVSVVSEEEKAKEEAKLLAADSGEPFYVKNPDAEDTTGSYTATSSNASITITPDPTKSGNKAYLVTPTVKDQKSWTYFVIPTRFKPGVTYKIEFDVMVTKDHLGNPVTDARFVPNLRYTDLNANGTEVKKMDHPVHVGIVKTSSGDGWKHCTIQHTISANSSERTNDFLCVYSEPFGTNDAPINVGFMIDNIKVTVVK